MSVGVCHFDCFTDEEKEAWGGKLHHHPQAKNWRLEELGVKSGLTDFEGAHFPLPHAASLMLIGKLLSVNFLIWLQKVQHGLLMLKAIIRNSRENLGQSWVIGSQGAFMGPASIYQWSSAEVVLVPMEHGWGLLLDPTDLSLEYVCACVCVCPCACAHTHLNPRDLRSSNIVGLPLVTTKGDSRINLCLISHSFIFIHFYNESKACPRQRTHSWIW